MHLDKGICEFCETEGINYKKGGTLFRKSSDDVKEIVSVCKELGIKYKVPVINFSLSSSSLITKQLVWSFSLLRKCKNKNFEFESKVLQCIAEKTITFLSLFEKRDKKA